MFDFDAGKLLVIGIVALVVIGPKELPRVLRQVGQMVTKLRRMAGEFQSQFMDAMREADLEDAHKSVTSAIDSAKAGLAYNPIDVAKREIHGALTDPFKEDLFGTAKDPMLDQDMPKFGGVDTEPDAFGVDPVAPSPAPLPEITAEPAIEATAADTAVAAAEKPKPKRKSRAKPKTDAKADGGSDVPAPDASETT